MNHTPGPWTVEDVLTHRNEPHAYRIVADHGKRRYRILATTPDGWGEACENFANAHLIAAAPDLLQAVKHLLAAAKCHYDPIVALSEYGAKAEAAIAKAEGGAPDGSH